MKVLARASAGLMLWAVAFMLLYSLHGIGCTAAWHQVPFAGSNLFRWALVCSWMLFGAGAIATILWTRRLAPGFERQVAFASACAGAVAIVVAGMPVAVTSACM